MNALMYIKARRQLIEQDRLSMSGFGPCTLKIPGNYVYVEYACDKYEQNYPELAEKANEYLRKNS
jgi:hypothetical protein